VSTRCVVPQYLASQFYMWLWWASEASEGHFQLSEEQEAITLWVDDFISFRDENYNKTSVVLSGENPSASLESRATLVGGKIIDAIRVRINRDCRDFYVTLTGPEIKFKAVKLPVLIGGDSQEALYDRMFLYEELSYIITELFREFCETRVSTEWSQVVEPRINEWAIGATK